VHPAPLYRYCPYDGVPLVFTPSEERTCRPSCPDCGFVDYQNPKPCVAVLILNEAGQVLLARCGVEPRKGMWDTPGGFIEAGESAEDAVVRECREETALVVRVADFLGSLPDAYGPGGVPVLNLCFLARVVSGSLTPQSDVAELRWFGREELPQEMAFPHQRPLLQWAWEK
jgi:NADH pyrophosphatase NudC (nudix superfamily)